MALRAQPGPRGATLRAARAYAPPSRAQGSRARPQLGDRLTRALRNRGVYCVAAALVLVAHLSLALPIYAWYDRLGAWLPFVILLVLLYRYVRLGEKSVPVLMLVALQVYVFYSVPQFSQEGMLLYSGLYQPSERAITSSVALVILGELAFIAGFQLIRKVSRSQSNLFDRILPKPAPNWALGIVLYSLPSLVIYLLNTLRPDYIPVGFRFMALQFFNIYLALVLALYLAYRFQHRTMLKFAFLLIGVMALGGFIQGVMGNIVNPILILFVCAWIWGRAIRKRWVFVALLAIIVINPVKNQFRRLEWGDKDVSSWAKIERRLTSWGTAFENVWDKNSASANVMETASRTSDLIPLAQAVDLVPQTIPYNRGQGMAVALIYWIPRVFWPTKPSSSDLLFNRYAVEFGYTVEEATQTSTTGASTFTEGYWNFGWIGVGGFLLALGVLLGFFFGNNGKHGDSSTIVCMAYFAGVMLFLQPLSLTVSSMLTFTAGIWLAMTGIAWLAEVAPMGRGKHVNVGR
jgi:hypothetical protein